ncbi:N-acetylmannosamine-6-phosphate 2-epimerase [Bacillus sp. 1P02SD]|uniref:N-acetylmannosamine-6-phosphate 2-epimerase n=1 Tax=Bacillus sp. 1P02SD TaxID=3132264 RepID=UPI00399FE691
MKKEDFFLIIHKHLIVSCQALDHEPLHGSMMMAKMALAAKEGGAVAIRCNSAADCSAIKEQTGLPVVALLKRDYPDSEIFITATLKEVKELLAIEPDVIALDATVRKRPNGETLEELVSYIHKKSNALVMADIATLMDADYAIRCGVDMVSTTLSGYTTDSPKLDGPDFELVEQLCKVANVPVIAEGRISTPEQARKMLELGAWSIVVGSAITRPQLITRTFTKGIFEV